MYEVKHKKTNKTYVVINDYAIDCTNSENDKRMVIYTNNDLVFVREYNEFFDKFEIIDNE